MKQTLLLTLFAAFSFSVANAQVPSYVPTDGLVGWWPFNGDAADESGNGNDGTVVGATLAADRNGVENAAYSFDGDDWIETSYEGIPNNDSRTISVWMLSTLSASRQSIVAYGSTGSSSSAYNLWTGWNCNGIGLDIYGSAIDYNFSFSPTVWTNIVLVFDNSLGGTLETIKMYANGELLTSICSSQQGYVTINTPNSENLTFGRYHAVLDRFFHGSLDDIGIWNRALTGEEILNLYDGCNVNPTAIVGGNAPLNFTTSTYFCNDNPGSSYTWTVTNGVISSGQGTNSIVVLWGNEGEGTVSVIETNAEGCDGPVASFIVDVQCSSNITSIDGNFTPVILSPIAYTVNGPAESEYAWSVTNGVIVSGQGTNSVNVIWAAEGEGTLSVIETTSTGCESPEVTITTNATVTSVIEQEEKRISIYPNPASDRMTLQCGAENIGEEYIIYNALGKIVMRGKIINTVTTININELRSDEYFIKIGEEVIKAVKE